MLLSGGPRVRSSGRYRLLALITVVTCVSVGLTLTSSSPVAALSRCSDVGSLHQTLVVGVPVRGIELVDVHDIFGGPQRVIRPESLGLVGAFDDRFGAAIVSADFNLDGCLDLVIGAPGTDGVGAVYVVFGTTAGVGLGPVVRLPYTGSAGDAFGAALAVEALPVSDAPAHIWVGAPGRDVNGKTDAGGVVHYLLTGTRVSGKKLVTQDSPGTPGAAEAGDQFGQVLSAGFQRVWVGEPREDVGNVVDAGMVTMLPAPGGDLEQFGAYALTENSRGIGGVVESGDRFGAALDGGLYLGDVVVGVPDEDLGSIRDTGMVHMIQFEQLIGHPVTWRDYAYISQNSAGVPGTAEAGDRFGASVQLSFRGRCAGSELAIGAPGEDIGSVADAGAITQYSDPHSEVLCGSHVYHRGSKARPGDALGARLGVLLPQPYSQSDEETRWVMGAPGESVGSVPDAGVVEVMMAWELEVGQSDSADSSFALSTGSSPGTRYGSVISKLCQGCQWIGQPL